MATTLNNAPIEYVFSSQLEDLDWTTDAQEITVQLARTGENAEKFYNSKLKSFDGKIRLWEVRDLVEEYMRNHSLACMDLQIVWIEPQEGGPASINGTSTFVVYNALDTAEPAEWVHEHFLSTLQMKTLPNPGESETLAFINLDYRLSTPVYLVSVELADGSQTVVTLQPDEPVYAPRGLAQVNIDMDEITQRAAEELDQECTVLQLMVKVGERYMVYSRPRPGEEPGIVLAFLNAFNAVEWCRLHGVTTVKTQNDAKMAMVSRRVTKYDQEVNVTHEVVTAPLIHEVARWLAQLTTAPMVWMMDGTEVVIESDSHEFSDDPHKMNEVKFSWKRTDKRDRMRHDLTAGGIFNLVYNEIYA